MQAHEVEALARATLAQGLIHMVVHFPDTLGELALSPETAMQQALRLAEESIQLAPQLPDGHAVLARIILCHDDPEALADAMEVVRHALELDGDHDPAEVTLAVAQWAQGDNASAKASIDRVLRRGNGLPQPLLLRALIACAENRLDDARRDIERAVRLAPSLGQFSLDAAEIAAGTGDVQSADRYREEARRLLGEAYTRFASARGGLP